MLHTTVELLNSVSETNVLYVNQLNLNFKKLLLKNESLNTYDSDRYCDQVNLNWEL